MEYKTFCIDTKTTYVEHPIKHELFNKFYEIVNPEYEDILSIPDGCVNIWFLWNKRDFQTRLIGSGLQGKYSIVSNYEKCFGIKFNSGVIPAVFLDNIKYIVNNNCLINEYVDVSFIEENIKKADSFDDRVNFMVKYEDYFGENRVNTLVGFLIQSVHRMDGNLTITDLASVLGYSSSYINRTFRDNMGMSLKKYSCIVRAQNSIVGIEKKDTNYIYEKLGYYDQAHFIKDFKHYTLLTPQTCLKKGRFFV